MRWEWGVDGSGNIQHDGDRMEDNLAKRWYGSKLFCSHPNLQKTLRNAFFKEESSLPASIRIIWEG